MTAKIYKAGVVVHICTSNLLEAEAGGLKIWVCSDIVSSSSAWDVTGNSV